MSTNRISSFLSRGLSTFLLGTLMASSILTYAQTGKALHFDGTNDWVDVGTTIPNLPNGNSPWTVEAWVKTSQTSIGNIVSWGNRTTNNRVGVAVRFNGAAFIGENNDLTPANTAKINDNVWHHVAVVCQGTTSNNIQIYVDGSLKSQGLGALNVSGQALRLGRISNPDNGEYFAGTMDEVRIWNFARTGTQINNDKGKELQGNESGLIVYYNFNHGIAGGNNATETTLVDQANSSDGDLINFALTGSTSNWVGDAPTLVPATTPISCNIVNPTISCFGENNGSATVEVSGGNTGSAYSYSWSAGSTTNGTAYSITGLAAGAYTVTVTQGSVSTTCAVTITESAGPIQLFFLPSSFGEYNISMKGGSNGQIKTYIDGGVSPYIYSWEGPSAASGPNPTGLKSGAYFLRVVDDQGCTGSGGPLNMRDPQ